MVNKTLEKQKFRKNHKIPLKVGVFKCFFGLFFGGFFGLYFFKATLERKETLKER